MVSRTFSGRLYDLYGHKVVFIPGATAVFLAMLLLFWLPNSFVLFLAASLYGLGFGTVQPALQAWAVNKAPDNRKGMANATFFSFFDLGVGMGAITFGLIASLTDYRFIYLASAVSLLCSISLYIYLIFIQRWKAAS